MKILITGATGLVGHHLIEQAKLKNWSINFLTTSKDKLTQPFVQGFYWNPKTQEIDPKCLEGVDVIFHLAGASVANRWTSSYKKEILDSRVQGTQLLFKVIQNNEHQVKHLISASAIGIYPDSLTDYYQEDQSATANNFLGNVVTQWETQVDQINSLNIPVAKIRIGLVLAEEGGALKEMVKPIKMGVGAYFGSGEQWQSWIHVTDLARLFCFVAENKLSGVYNGVAPDPVTNKYLTKAIAEHLKKSLWLPPIPKFVMSIILGEMHQILFYSHRVSADKISSKGFKFLFQDVKIALEDLL